MDKLQFQCSGCGKGVSAPAERAGKTGKCPSCGVAIQIPNASGRQDQAASSNVAQHVPQATTTAGGGDGVGSGTPTTAEGVSAWILQLKTIGNVLKLGYLYLYCPLRRKRETLPQERWLLLALLPPAGAFLVALVLSLFSRGTTGGFFSGMAVVIVISAGIYALLAVQASVFGPSAHDAEAALAPIMARLRGLRQTTRTLREEARSVRQAIAAAPPLGRSPAPYHAPAGISQPAPSTAQTQQNQSCDRCKYRLPRKLCGYHVSPRYGRRIDSSQVCSYFQASVGESKSEQILKVLEDLIELGLGEKTDVQNRAMLADSYRELAVEHKESLDNGPLISEAVKQLESAVRIDSQRRYGVFKPLDFRYMFPPFDAFYSIMSDSIETKKGVRAAIKYLEKKLTLFKRVPGDPMIGIMFNLAKLYFNGRRDRRKARMYLCRVLRAQVIPGWESRYEELRELANENVPIVGKAQPGCLGQLFRLVFTILVIAAVVAAVLAILAR